MTLLYQFVCPRAKELEQMTMDEFVVQACRNAMFVGVVDVTATSKLSIDELGVDQINLCVFNKPTLLNIPKGGFMLVDSEGEVMIFPFVCCYSLGQMFSFCIRSVKFKDQPSRVKQIAFNSIQKGIKAE